MGNGSNDLGKNLTHGLRLSSDDVHENEKEEVKESAKKGRVYWQEYKKRKKRVFGWITNQEDADLTARAKVGGRSRWGQVWAESRAYIKGERLPTHEESGQKQLLIAELRRVGNNINQLARLGHIEARKHGGLVAPDGDHIGLEVLRQFSRLERLVTNFADGMKISVSLDDDHKSVRDDH